MDFNDKNQYKDLLELIELYQKHNDDYFEFPYSVTIVNNENNDKAEYKVLIDRNNNVVFSPILESDDYTFSFYDFYVRMYNSSHLDSEADCKISFGKHYVLFNNHDELNKIRFVLERLKNFEASHKPETAELENKSTSNIFSKIIQSIGGLFFYILFTIGGILVLFGLLTGLIIPAILIILGLYKLIEYILDTIKMKDSGDDRDEFSKRKKILGVIGLLSLVAIIFIMFNINSSHNTSNSIKTYSSSSTSQTQQIESIKPTAICADGSYSYSNSRRGTCSHHGGVSYWYY